jgi:hypothetical protein
MDWSRQGFKWMDEYLGDLAMKSAALSTLESPAARYEQFVQRYMNDLHVQPGRLTRWHVGF